MDYFVVWEFYQKDEIPFQDEVINKLREQFHGRGEITTFVEPSTFTSVYFVPDPSIPQVDAFQQLGWMRGFIRAYLLAKGVRLY